MFKVLTVANVVKKMTKNECDLHFVSEKQVDLRQISLNVLRGFFDISP